MKVLADDHPHRWATTVTGVSSARRINAWWSLSWVRHRGKARVPLPKERSRRDQTYRRIGDDGMHLLQMIWAQDAPPALRGLPEAEVLRKVWVQYFHLVEVEGEVARRGPKDRPPGLIRLVPLYDLEARTGGKRDISWTATRFTSPRRVRTTPRIWSRVW
jgi:hypothetical protein